MDCENTQPAELPVHPRTGLRAVGVLPSGRIVWPIMGGSGEGDDEDDGGDDDGDDSSDGDGDDEGDDGSEGDDDGGTKPQKKAGDTVSRAELAKAIASRDDAKKKLREKTRELDDLRKKSETADETARREAAEEARKAADARYKPIAIRAALLEAGVLPARVKGATKLLDLDEVDVDEDGDVSGLDTQLAGLKADWPELFAAPEAEPGKKPEPKRGGADGADKKPTPKKPPTPSERQAAQLLGKTA